MLDGDSKKPIIVSSATNQGIVKDVKSSVDGTTVSSMNENLDAPKISKTSTEHKHLPKKINEKGCFCCCWQCTYSPKDAKIQPPILLGSCMKADEIQRQYSDESLVFCNADQERIRTGNLLWLYNETNVQHEIDISDIESRISCIHKPLDASLFVIGIMSFVLMMIQVLDCISSPNQFGGFLGSVILMVAGFMNFITVGAFTLIIVVCRLFSYVSIILVMLLQVILQSIHLRRLHNIIYIQRDLQLYECQHALLIFVSCICLLLLVVSALSVSGIGMMLTIDEIIQVMKTNSRIEVQNIQDSDVARGFNRPIV